MKANEAPERLYFGESDKGILDIYSTKESDNEVEYTRTDAFIKKACEWIEEINNHHHIMRYSDSCESPLSELTEWFKNYMEG